MGRWIRTGRRASAGRRPVVAPTGFGAPMLRSAARACAARRARSARAAALQRAELCVQCGSATRGTEGPALPAGGDRRQYCGQAATPAGAELHISSVAITASKVCRGGLAARTKPPVESAAGPRGGLDGCGTRSRCCSTAWNMRPKKVVGIAASERLQVRRRICGLVV